jgi:peptidoglycan/xylan/chitin deacetylase (PgdA/CDA1 family)
MPASRIRGHPLGVALRALAVAALAHAAGAAANDEAPAARVALTFDDLPAHAALPPGTSRADVAREILAALAAQHAPPVYGFVNAKALSDDPGSAEVLKMWRAAGQPLGNHTVSHMDLNANTAEAFELEIVGDEPTLRRYMDEGDWRWLRFPYLREGDTPEKQRAVARFLAERHYRVAEVTISFDDYAYNDPYARCVAKDDRPAIAWMKESWLRRARASLSSSQEAARLAFGRDIPHVMLLHIGAFDAVMMKALLELLAERRFELVTLPQAEADPAYTGAPKVALPSGATLQGRALAARGITPPPAVADDTLARLAGLCR